MPSIETVSVHGHLDSLMSQMDRYEHLVMGCDEILGLPASTEMIGRVPPPGNVPNVKGSALDETIARISSLIQRISTANDELDRCRQEVGKIRGG